MVRSLKELQRHLVLLMLCTSVCSLSQHLHQEYTTLRIRDEPLVLWVRDDADVFRRGMTLPSALVILISDVPTEFSQYY